MNWNASPQKFMLLAGNLPKEAEEENLVTVDIGTLITTNPKLRGGRPIIAGTATSVRRIAALYKQGYSAEEIVRKMDCLSLTQIYAALTYYHANREEVDADLAAEQAEYERLAALHARKSLANAGANA